MLRVGLLLTMLGIAGCSSPLGTLRLDEAVRQQVDDGAANVHDFAVQRTRMWEDKTIVLYSSATNPTGRLEIPEFGYALVQRQGIGWTVDRRVSFGGTPVPPLVAYSTDQLDTTLLIFGKVTGEAVAAVEVTFDTGEVVRDEADDNVFALFSKHSTQLRELRVLGANGQVLQRYTQPELTYADAGNP